MNKRILELAKQANVLMDFGDDITVGRYSIGGSYEQMEEFAELIVWECIAVCKSRVGITDYNTGRMHCASDIRDHFGVK
jgi:hypothetical protein